MKSQCICSHSESSHVNDFDNTRCCACWKSRQTGFVVMCDCMKFEVVK
jgi:hypothetical protein